MWQSHKVPPFDIELQSSSSTWSGYAGSEGRPKSRGEICASSTADRSDSVVVSDSTATAAVVVDPVVVLDCPTTLSAEGSGPSAGLSFKVVGGAPGNVWPPLANLRKQHSFPEGVDDALRLFDVTSTPKVDGIDQLSWDTQSDKVPHAPEWYLQSHDDFGYKFEQPLAPEPDEELALF